MQSCLSAFTGALHPEARFPRSILDSLLALTAATYASVAALNLTTSSAGTRPRSLTSMP